MKTAVFKILILYLLMSFPFEAYTQNNTIDSLKRALETEKEDTNKVNTLNFLSDAIRTKTYDTNTGEYTHSIFYAQQALNLSKKINFERGKRKAWKNIGTVYFFQKNYPEALKYYSFNLKSEEQAGNKFESAELYRLIGNLYNEQKNYPEAIKNLQIALKISLEIGAKSTAAYTYDRIASVYYRQDNIAESIKNYYAALKVFEETGNEWGIGLCLQNIGGANYYLGDDSEALRNWIACLNIRKKTADKAGIAQTNNCIGWIYIKQGKYTEALQNFHSALNIFKEINGTSGSWGIPMSYESIGSVYEKQGDVYLTEGDKKAAKKKFTEALTNYFEALKEWKRKKDDFSIASCYIHIGNANAKMKNTSISKNYLQRALALSLQTNRKEQIKDSYLALSSLDSSLQHYNAAYEHYKQYILYRDSLVNEENTKKALRSKIQYEFDKKKELDIIEQKKKQAIAKAVQDKKDALSKAEIENQKIIRNFSFALASLILSSSIYWLYRYKRKKALQNQQSLMNERLRISRELHDEVGATLSGIAMYSHLTKEQIKNTNTTEVVKSLDIMQQSAGEMVNKLNDIVWLINPDQDSLQKLIQRLEEYAGDMAAIKNMQAKISVPQYLHEHSLPMESRRNIYLFCKEAINNAVKYSNGTLLELNIKEIGNKLEFSVSDNGKGFDAVMVRRGNGLENMQKRADEIGAKLTVQSKQDEGSLVSMQIKIT
jgi:signal transduction histidine kinase